jgi:membrane associated rhomboid family serine protease
MEPPNPTDRMTDETPGAAFERRPPAWVHRSLMAVPVILGINVVVFVAWMAPPLRTFLIDNFAVSMTRVGSGMVWTLVTAAFSHYELWHLALNMIVLWSFGGVIERLLGMRRFVAFYLTAAVVASVSHCFVSVLMGRPDLPALGASGAVSGLLLVYALLFPRHRILIFGVIPVPALIGAMGFVALDIWGLIAQTQGGGLPIGHGAHLGGAACGAVYYFAILKARVRQAHDGPPPIEPGRQPFPRLSPEEAGELARLQVKIAEQGIDSLTPKEQHFLLRLRERG